MKNSNGFTLIELLAVIVILVVLALITVPLIMNVVKKSRMSAAKNSAMSYLDGVEKYVMYHEVNDAKYQEEIASGVYQASTTPYTLPDGKIAVEGKNLNNILGTTVKGTKPSEGYVEIDEKKKITGAELIINDYKVTCTSSTSCTVEGEMKSESKKITADEVEISISGLDKDNVADVLDYLYERSN